MKLQFLGSGSAFVRIKENYQSNMILESDTGKRLMIDCGSDARHSIRDVNLSHNDIDAVYISHFHADHVGGLEWLAFTRKFDPNSSGKPKLYIHRSMLAGLWDHVISGGLRSLEQERATLQSYFEVASFENALHFTWESLKFELVKTIHVYDGSEVVPSYGLFISNQHTQIFITTDTQFKPQNYMTYYQKADIIFHDCEIKPHKSCVHANFDELVTLDESIRAKMWLYHYSSGPLPDAITHGFRGFVKRGQTFSL